MANRKKNKGTFTKQRPGPGRPKGVPNKTTAQAKQMSEEVAMRMGGADALLKWAQKHKTQFYQYLFTRLLPLQVNARVDSKEPIIYETIDEVRAAMIARGVDADRIIEVILDGAYKAPPKLLEQKNGKTQ